MSDVETVSQLELLHRLAEHIDATVCLTTTRDSRRNGKLLCAGEPGAALSRLVVIRPAHDRGLGRVDRLLRGQTLACAQLDNAGPLEHAAAALVEHLQAATKAA